mgnify:CR=1 FL=1
MSTNKVTEHDDKLLWTISDIAEQLAVDRKTISRLIAKGELPVVQIGRCKRVPKQAVLDWISGQTRYNLEGVETMCASTGEKPCQSLNVVMEEVEITTSMSDTDLEKRLSDLRERVTNG